jgi:hypothetical protein
MKRSVEQGGRQMCVGHGLNLQARKQAETTYDIRMHPNFGPKRNKHFTLLPGVHLTSYFSKNQEQRPEGVCICVFVLVCVCLCLCLCVFVCGATLIPCYTITYKAVTAVFVCVA